LRPFGPFSEALIARREPLNLPADRFLLLDATRPLEVRTRHDQILEAGALADHEDPQEEESQRREDDEHGSDVSEIQVHGWLLGDVAPLLLANVD
jgi:hypothetical protein